MKDDCMIITIAKYHDMAVTLGEILGTVCGWILLTAMVVIGITFIKTLVYKILVVLGLFK